MTIYANTTPRTRGGYRPGSGRKPTNPTGRFNAVLTQQAADLLDAARDRGEETRANTVKNALTDAYLAGRGPIAIDTSSPTPARYSGRIDPEVHAWLIAIAKDRGVTLSQVIDGLIREHVG